MKINSEIDKLINEAIADNVFLEAVIHKNTTTQANDEKIFDIASLTKVIASYVVVSTLIDKKIAIEVKISDLINIKSDITILELLTHRSGLRDYFLDGVDKKSVFNVLEDEKLILDKKKTSYADINFIVLYYVFLEYSNSNIVEDFLLDRKIKNITYNPKKTGYILVENETRGIRKTIGEVHDTKCFDMGGVSFHAGLFATAKGIDTFLRIMLEDKEFLKILEKYENKDRTICFITNDQTHFIEIKKYWFHTGYTGCCILIDREQQTFVVILSNRTIIQNYQIEKIINFRNKTFKYLSQT